VSFQLVLIEQCLVADESFEMFPVSIDHISEMLSVLMNPNDALGGKVCCWI